jgi:hypothetical protein
LFSSLVAINTIIIIIIIIIITTRPPFSLQCGALRQMRAAPNSSESDVVCFSADAMMFTDELLNHKLD